MASLAGKADPTIVAMAYKAAMANVPFDRSKHYDTIADAYAFIKTKKLWEGATEEIDLTAGTEV